MIRYILIYLSLLLFNFSYGQKFYDVNDLNYYLDFSSNTANLKLLEYEINGPVEEIVSFYGNKFTIIKGDSIHWVLGQSKTRNKFSSYLIIKGEYNDIRKLARREVSGKKYEIIDSDITFSGYFNDYLNFVTKEEFDIISKNRLIGEYLKEYDLIGEYNIRIIRLNEIDYESLDIKGKLKITTDRIIIESNLPTLTRFIGSYDYYLNQNPNFLREGLIRGRISNNTGVFSLNIDKEKKLSSITTIKIDVDEKGIDTINRQTSFFNIID